MKKKLSFLFSIYHFLLSFLANLLFGFPSKKIFVLGVTGTKGKSTVVELISFILEKAGYKVASLSSVWVKIGEERKKNLTDMTMPGRFFIQKFLRKAVKAECQYALVEVTSQGVVQHRHKFIDWNGAMFLNLAPEHIEAHGGFEKYREAKLKFFRYVAKQKKENNESKRLFFINRDDPNSEYFIESSRSQNGKIILFSKNQIPAYLSSIRKSTFLFPEDIAAAWAFAKEIGISGNQIEKFVKEFPGLSGRMEIIQEKPFKVIIDYAHTPDSLCKVYRTLLRLKPKTKNQKPKMICLLGSAGGGRDKWKRPKMGEIAAKYCRTIILTNEDPYNENPAKILSEIKSGIISSQFSSSNLFEILDRREAIKKAISLAKEGDVVIITGKGSENWIHQKGGKIPWNERKIVEEEIKRRKG